MMMSDNNVISSSSSTTELILLKAISLFYKEFHALPTTASFAPGRVNLIGELS